MTTPNPPLAAEIHPVREVSLLGTADLAPWTELLQNEGLAPAARGGKAQVLITASDSVFKGVPFRELAFSVKAVPTGAYPEAEGYTLLHAFNSSRFFAFIERAVFHTPYYPAAVTVDTGLPASVRATRGAQTLFRAEMGSEPASRQPLSDGPDGYRGPIFLPGGRVFYATIEGRTQTYAFDPERDEAIISPTAREPLLERLRDSGFRGETWFIRESARHAKSKTIARR